MRACVGWQVEVDPSEQDRVAAHLLDKFNCVPTFLPPDLSSKCGLPPLRPPIPALP